MPKDLNQPLMASLDITYRCNLRCRTCNVYKIRKSEKELNLEEWKTLVNQIIQAFSIQLFRLVGGESFMHPDFEEIVHHIKAKGARLTIVTNGTLISRKMSRFLVSQHVDRIRISLNGLEKTDDFYRGKGTFAKTMKGIQAIIQEKENQSADKPKIEIHPFVSKVNCGEISKLLLLSTRIGADFNYHFMETTKIRDPGFPEDPQEISAMSLEERKEFEEKFSKLRSFRERFLPRLFSKVRELSIWHDCVRTAYHLLVDPWGYVFPCEYLRNYPYGNCTKEYIEEIWWSQKRGALRQQIKEGRLHMCHVCGALERRVVPLAPLVGVLPLAFRLNWLPILARK